MRRWRLVAFLAGWAGWAAAQPAVLELKREALLDHARITLADLAIVQGWAAALGGLELGAAPRIGYVERISREQIALLIRRRTGVAGEAIVWRGAPSVAVRSQAQALAPAELTRAALQGLRVAYGSRFPAMTVEPASLPAALELPIGVVEIRPRGLAGGG